MDLRSSPVFAGVAARIQKYEKVGRVLDPSSFKLQWKREDAALWVNAPPGATWFEYRLAATLDGTLGEIMVALNEFDLAPRYQPQLVGPPTILGEHTRNQFVLRSLISLLMLRIEIMVEISRFVDTANGVLVEHVQPPPEGTPLPPKTWQNKRISVNAQNIFLPRGGDRSGTVIVSVTHIEVGVRLPEFILNFVINQMAKDFLDNLHTCVKLAKTPGSLWQKRLEEDASGCYAQLRRVEQAAVKRQECSVDNLPGSEVFERPWRITQDSKVGTPPVAVEAPCDARDSDVASKVVLL